MKIHPAKGFGGFYKRLSGGDKPRPYKKEIVCLRFSYKSKILTVHMSFLVLLDITNETELLLYHHFASPLCITTDFVMSD
jgi:hypothetical protein